MGNKTEYMLPVLRNCRQFLIESFARSAVVSQTDQTKLKPVLRKAAASSGGILIFTLGETAWNDLHWRAGSEWTKGETAGALCNTAVSTDSRRIPQEALFLPLAGERFDGHDFIGKALENGAAAVMSHRACEKYPVPALRRNTSLSAARSGGRLPRDVPTARSSA